VPTDDTGAAPPGWYADPQHLGTRRWWSGAAWTEYIDEDPVGAADARSSSSGGTRRRTRRFRVIALAVAFLALAGAAVIRLATSSGTGDAATSKPTSAKAASGISSAAASASTPCRIIPRSSKFTWSGPALSTFSGVSVPGSGQSAGTAICEAQANGILYHFDISQVALSAPNEKVEGTTRIAFGHTIAFVSEQPDLTSWLFEDGSYSGEVFFQTIGPPTAAYPPHADTERLIRLLVATASRQS
jgi:hypothetical protein